MRVFPVLDWHYCDIWNFLRKFDLPYSKLYDEGYTSIGEKQNTIKNPHLAYEIDGEIRYLPAYELKDEAYERECRADS